MRGDLLPRSDIARPDFPEYLMVGGMHMERIEDEFAKRLSDGDPILGWGGDNRLKLYSAPADGMWCLVRYCEDRSFQLISVEEATPGNWMNALGRFVDFLVRSDSRRGVNLGLQVAAHNEKRTAEVDAELERWVDEEGAPRAAAQMMGA